MEEIAVLIVDDEQGLRDMLTTVLKRRIPSSQACCNGSGSAASRDGISCGCDCT